MTFRITTTQMAHRALLATQRHLRGISDAQLQTTTGLRVNRPSDDPLATRSILSHRTLDRRLDADRHNIQSASDQLNVSVSHLLELKNLLVKAKDIALESPQTTERFLLADEIDTMFDRVVGLANESFDGHYLFGGTSVTTKPFSVADGRQVAYEGGSRRSSTVVGVGLEFDVLYRGDEVFQPQDRQSTLVIGSTGAAHGRGTDSGVGRGTLEVSHTQTIYQPGSGVSAGTDSVTGDTIVGALGRHHLTLVDTSGDGSSGTVSLNDGPPVTYNSSDTNLMVTGPRGGIVYVDTTSITPGFNGQIDLTGQGELSVDGGASTIPIDFGDNQLVQHNASGQVTFIDSSAIHRTGSDRLDYVGTADVFQLLSSFADDLRIDSDDSDTEWQASVSRAIGDFDRMISHIVSVVGEQSATLEGLVAIESRYEQVQLEYRSVVAELESADMTEVVLNLQTQQNLLQFTYATTATLFDQNLLDFI